MTETDPEKRLIGYACISTYGQMLDTQLSRAHLRRRRRSGIGRLTDPTAAAQLWLRAGSSCPFPAIITEPSNGDIGWIPDLMNESCDYPRISGFKGVVCNVHTHRDKPIATTLGTSARATST
jgi:hypothetical protein